MTEREKYDKMHSVPGYSPGPGVSRVPGALRHIEPGSSIIDFGCGTGDAAWEFKERGYAVTAVDISDKGLTRDIRFFRCPLHKLPQELPASDWGFCVDVMEHLPTVWVPDSLWQMSRKVENCYFVIKGTRDSWGIKINDVLHLSVMPGQWWLEEISECWKDVLLTIEGDSYEIVARGAKK